MASVDVSEVREVEGDHSCQGPINWRKNLKPIASPLVENKVFVSKEVMEEEKAAENAPNPDRIPAKDGKRLTKPDLEEGRIRERLKNMPNTKAKEKGPLIAKPLLASGTMLAPQANGIFRTGSFQENPTVGGLRKAAILRSGSFHETPFTRNVVNRPQSPGIPRRRISPSNSFTKGYQASGRRTPSPNTPFDLGDSAKKRVDKVLRARLYLLQQMGPNSFLIGGDNPDNKFKVIIGPQTCSCCRPHCIHLLFIMLRVFQVRENDALLWSKPLKNFEVENLFRLYHARRTSRIKSPAKKATSVAKPSSPPPSPSSPDSAASPNSDVGSRNDEESCPICLMELMEEEATVSCEGGCQNKLHLHCIAVWFQLCRKQHDTLICPLCRAQWKGHMEEINSEPVPSSTSTPEPDVSINNRASSPQPVSTDTENLLPRPEPIPAEFAEISRPWLEILSEDLISCLVSRNWSVRETGLRHLAKEVIAALLPTVGEGRQGVVVSPERQQTAKKNLTCCFSVLTFTCSDPVYKVFVASLRVLRSVLSYTPCRDPNKQTVLQTLLKPVVDAILLKCADGNRRTSQLSTSTILELAKGQEGELAVGREITNPGSEGLGSVNFVLSCVTEDYNPKDVQWQWLLGRIHTIDKLVEEFQHEFLVDTESEDEESTSTDSYEDVSSYCKVMAVLKFSLKALDHSHMRIGKTARRVFIRTARFVVHIPKLFKNVEDMLNCLDPTLQSRMKHRLLLILNEYQGQVDDDSLGSDAAQSCPVPIPGMSARSVQRESPRGLDSPRNTIIINNYVTDKVVVVRRDGKHGFTPVSSSDVQRNESPAGQEDTPSMSPRSKIRRPNTLKPPQKRLIHWKSAFAFATNESEHLLIPQPPPEPASEDGEESPEVVTQETEDARKLSESASETNDNDSEEKAATESLEKETVKETVEAEVPPIEQVCGPAVRTSIHFGDDFLVTSHIGANGEVTTYTSQSDSSTSDTLSNSLNSSVPKVLPPKSKVYPDKAMAPLPPDPKAYTPLPPLPVVKVSDANGEVIGNPGVIDSPDEPFPRNLNNTSSVDEVDDGYKIENEPSLRFLCDPAYPGLLKRKAIYCACGGNDGCMDCEQILRSMLGESSVEFETESCDTQPETFTDDEDIREELTFTDDELSDQVSTCPSGSTTPRGLPAGCSPSSREYLETNLDDLPGEEQAQAGVVESATAPPGGCGQLQRAQSCKTQDSGMVTQDLSDFALSPSTPDDAVSFKSEVAVLSPRQGEPEENCHCKEEVELEEAVALAKAMEISEKQDALPIVPGLRGCHPDANAEEEKTLVIQVQNENGSGDGKAPVEYKENKQWVRGVMIGTGAYSTCYQARDVQTGVLMAVKQISYCRNSKSEQQKVVEAVCDEIQMMARLNHPNIVRILGATQQGSHFNMFVEWMPGGSVSYLLDRFGAFSEPVISSYTQQVLVGLTYLHEHHMLHRDLKGANILVDSTGKRIRIGDFGTAARLVSHQTGAGEFQGQMLGTIAFMAPEVLRGESYGRSCDIWSVGCCMIEMHTTKPPWGASDLSNHLKLIYKIASAKDPPPIPEGMSPAVKDLLLRCVEISREHRPSAKELLQHPLFTRYKVKPS